MDAVAQVRRFNRTVTQQIGALDARFLGRNRSLGASRLLFEVGMAGIEVRQLRSRLGLDSGYMSRLLRGLEAEGLVRTGTSDGDARVRFVSLTTAGRRELALLDRLSDDAAESLLGRLPAAQRSSLVAAMASVERLLLGGAVQLRVEKPDTRAARFCMDAYFRELASRFDAGFDPAICIPVMDKEITPPCGFLVLATLSGDPVGCGALKCHPGYAEVKRMWVARSARGLGIGRRILERLEEIARKRRVPVLRLDTNKALTEAQALYRRSGYREVGAFNNEPYAHLWFEKRLPPARRDRRSARVHR